MPTVHVHYPFDDWWLRRRRKDENGSDDGEGVSHLSRPKAAKTMKTIKKDFDRKTFYICPDPRQGQNNREEPHHAESFPEKKENICGHCLSFRILLVQNHK